MGWASGRQFFNYWYAPLASTSSGVPSWLCFCWLTGLVRAGIDVPLCSPPVGVSSLHFRSFITLAHFSFFLLLEICITSLSADLPSSTSSTVPSPLCTLLYCTTNNQSWHVYTRFSFFLSLFSFFAIFNLIIFHHCQLLFFPRPFLCMRQLLS